ncbi:hypothetical protein FA13DRAFT_1619379 [Coprinellus micaceus]|uniref:tRNA-splicing endonuclease subunit Sen54 N-terminal domain-containing protein n=1 Tax=Coprinellus micaceus TaxID=71717 RepID=A0A4Y7U107_COPMI|nr:hypothetical protein FA13DRAFT_1619379 [Coprinellus micaceus]
MRPVIPKRGEKEFEPRAGGSSLQAHILDRSRAAMFETLKATRTTSSKAISYGIWQPSLARTEVTVAKGIHFSSMGHSAPRYVADENGAEKLQKRLELLPEEAIYLIERGAMFCWKESVLRVEGLEGVPMTVQQAYSEMIGTEDLDLEKFQVYAYLKRLGYVVARARPPNKDYPASAPFSTSTPRRTVLERVKLLFGGFFSKIVRLFSKTADWWRPLRIDSCFFGITNYGSLFRSMRFIPSGHSVPLRREPPSEKPTPYQIFYNVYKPSTPFKKSSPPPPDFQMAVINARTTPMPTLQELTDLFEMRPDEPLPQPRKRGLPQQDAKPGTHNPPPTLTPTAPTYPPFLHRVFPSLFPVLVASKDRPRVVNPFTALKAGKKMIVIAVVDSGNVGFFRFSEGAFGEWPMA